MGNKIKTFDRWPALKTFGLAAFAFLYSLNLTSTHIIDKFISKSFLGAFLKDIYEACEASKAASVILLATFVFCLAFLFAKCIGRKSESVFTAIVLLILAFWIGMDDFWIYPSVSGCPNDFKWWLLGGLSITGLTILITNYKRPRTAKGVSPSNNDSHGFSAVQQYRCVDPENMSFVEK